ncbi:unnamed protein product [Effrenium voratum]|nr:unnamed protein product [Effrenium voratum]
MAQRGGQVHTPGLVVPRMSMCKELVELLSDWSQRLIRLPQAADIEVPAFKSDVEGVEPVAAALETAHRAVYRCRSLGVVSAEELAKLSRPAMCLQVEVGFSPLIDLEEELTDTGLLSLLDMPSGVLWAIQDVHALHSAALNKSDGVLVVVDASKHDVPHWMGKILREALKQEHDEEEFQDRGSLRPADCWIVANRIDQLPEFFCKENELCKKVMQRQYQNYRDLIVSEDHVIPVAARLSSLAMYGTDKVRSNLSQEFQSLEKKPWFAQTCGLMFGMHWQDQARDLEHNKWRSAMRELKLLGQVTGPLANSVLKTAYVKMMPHSVARVMGALSNLAWNFCSALTYMAGADGLVKARSFGGTVPEDRELVVAAVHNDARSVQRLAEHGFPCDKEVAGKMLLLSASRDRWNPVRTIVDGGYDLKSATGARALLLAASREHWAQVALLLERGASVCTEAAQVSFGLAAAANRKEIIEDFIGRGFKLDSWGGKKAVVEAASRGYLEVLQSLVSYGADLSSWAGDQSLQKATEKEHGEVMRFLVEKGVDVTGDLGDQVLESAAARNDVLLLQLLLDKGAQVGWSGARALTAAARCKSWEAVHFLILAEVDLTEWAGQVVLLAALEAQNLSILRVLEENGLDISSERSQITLGQVAIAPKVRKLLDEMQRRSTQRNAAAAAQLLASHATHRRLRKDLPEPPRGPAQAPRDPWLQFESPAARPAVPPRVAVARALARHVEQLDEHCLLVARQLAGHLLELDSCTDTAARALAEHLLRVDVTAQKLEADTQQVALALAEHVLTELGAPDASAVGCDGEHEADVCGDALDWPEGDEEKFGGEGHGDGECGGGEASCATFEGSGTRPSDDLAEVAAALARHLMEQEFSDDVAPDFPGGRPPGSSAASDGGSRAAQALAQHVLATESEDPTQTVAQALARHAEQEKDAGRVAEALAQHLADVAREDSVRMAAQALAEHAEREKDSAQVAAALARHLEDFYPDEVYSPRGPRPPPGSPRPEALARLSFDRREDVQAAAQALASHVEETPARTS